MAWLDPDEAGCVSWEKFYRRAAALRRRLLATGNITSAIAALSEVLQVGLHASAEVRAHDAAVAAAVRASAPPTTAAPPAAARLPRRRVRAANSARSCARASRPRRRREREGLFVCEARLFGRLGEAGVSSGRRRSRRGGTSTALVRDGAVGGVRQGGRRTGEEGARERRRSPSTPSRRWSPARAAGGLARVPRGGWDVWRRWEQRARTRGFADGVIGEAKAELGELTVGEVRRRTARNIWCVKHPDDLFTADSELEKRLEAGEPEMKQLLGRLLGDARARAAPGRRRAPSSLKIEAAERLGQKLYLAAWAGDALACGSSSLRRLPTSLRRCATTAAARRHAALPRGVLWARGVRVVAARARRPPRPGLVPHGRGRPDQRCLKIEARLAAREFETAAKAAAATTMPPLAISRRGWRCSGCNTSTGE